MENNTNETVKYCLYARKSSEAEEKQALSVDSQIKEMLTLSQRDNLNIVDIYRESHSAKDCGQRPVFNKMILDIKEGKFDGILVWHPDRLSRNAGDLGAIVDLLDQKKLVEIRTYSQRFTNNPNEKFLLMILGSQAKLENDNKSINVKRGLRTRVESGLWPSVPPTGYLSHPDRKVKCQVILDPVRHEVIKKMFEKAAYENYSGRKLFYWLRDEIKFRTKNGKPLTLSNIYIILKNHFYHGTFEYPKESGKWFKGLHEPIVSKELFYIVQEKLSTAHPIRSEVKEFAFTKLMTCGICGSGVTAQEKFKKPKNGKVHRYVYYGCTKFNDKKCPAVYLREEDLTDQLAAILDKISLDEIGMKEKIKAELEQHQRFNESVLGRKTTEKIKAKEVDIRNYAKYILRERNIWEKRELLSHLRSRLFLNERKITLC